MRPVRFLGDSLKSLRDFPEDARHDAGYQLDKVQRVMDESGAYRVIYGPAR
jgi:phage-related protein